MKTNVFFPVKKYTVLSNVCLPCANEIIPHGSMEHKGTKTLIPICTYWFVLISLVCTHWFNFSYLRGVGYNNYR